MSVQARTILEDSALAFVQGVEKAIHEGLRITNTNQGAPYLNTVLKEVYMVPADEAVAGPDELIGYTVEDDGVTVIVESYDNLIFGLTVQKAIVDGFAVKSVEFVPHGLKSAVLAKPTKAAPVAEPVVDATLAPVAEAPAPKKTTRKSK